MKESNVELACKALGVTMTGLAELLGVTKGAVHQWTHPGRFVPIHHAVAVEQITAGLVMRWDLRPNDWWLIWPELKDRSDSPPLPSEEVSHG